MRGTMAPTESRDFDYLRTRIDSKDKNMFTKVITGYNEATTVPVYSDEM